MLLKCGLYYNFFYNLYGPAELHNVLNKLNGSNLAPYYFNKNFMDAV